MGQQQLEHVILDGGESHRLPVHRHPLGPVIHGDGPHGEQAGALVRAPQAGISPQLGLHPGHHLQGVEGLGDIVVRPDVQAQDLVRVLALGGEEDNGHVAPLPQLGGGPDAVQLGHHHVHQDEMDLVLLHSPDGLPAVIGLQGAIALAGEIDVQGGDDVLVVVADQNGIHRLLSLALSDFLSLVSSITHRYEVARANFLKKC